MENVVIIECDWKNDNSFCFMVNVYAPHDICAKQSLWCNIMPFMYNHFGRHILFGIFNMVISIDERRGVACCSRSGDHFNIFIIDVR